MLVVAGAVALLWFRPWETRVRTARNVILISVDTLRQDHLSAYGYPRPTSPALERFAKRAVVFDNAMSQAPYTLSSHMTMLTGLHPRAHGVRYIGQSLNDRFTTLAEALRAAGFRTAAFTDGGLMGHEAGFNAGFEIYEDQRKPGSQGFKRRAQQLRDWVKEHAQERFFLFMHTFETHGPYSPDPRAREALAATRPVVPKGAGAVEDPIGRMRALNYHRYFEALHKYGALDELVDDYDACIRTVDDEIGAFLDYLDQEKLLDDTLVVITSDHGEAFFDHGLYVGHGLTLYEEEVRVPLFVKFPDDAFGGRRFDDVVRLMDLFPTVCEATDVPLPQEVQGAGLLGVVDGSADEPRVAFGESPNLGDPTIEGPEGVIAYARQKDRKYIDPSRLSPAEVIRRHLDRPSADDVPYDLETDPFGLKQLDVFRTRLFDLNADPDELKNLASDRGDEVKRIRRSVETFDAACDALRKSFVRDVPLDENLTEQRLQELIELGYIGGTDAVIKLQQIQRRDALKRQAEQRRAAGEGSEGEKSPGGGGGANGSGGRATKRP